MADSGKHHGLLHLTVHPQIFARFAKIWKFKKQAAGTPDESIKYAIVDAEVGIKDHKVHDIGALRFDGGPSFVQYHFDPSEHSIPEQIVLQLTHKDVVSSYFTSRKKSVLTLKGGDELDYADGYILHPYALL